MCGVEAEAKQGKRQSALCLQATPKEGAARLLRRVPRLRPMYVGVELSSLLKYPPANTDFDIYFSSFFLVDYGRQAVDSRDPLGESSS